MINDSNLNANSFRYERKFVISELDRYEVEAMIRCHTAMFSEIYHRRMVNNIYFDSLNMDSYFTNEAGTGQRVKIRIRWYGDLYGMIEKPVLEVKCKDNQLGSKMRFALLCFRLDADFSLNCIMEVLTRSNIPMSVREELMSMQMTLLTRYSRKYFQSVDRKYRLTIDWDIEYYILDNAYNEFRKKIHDRHNTVLELKYSDDNDGKSNIVSNFFPFRLSRNSKYRVGMDNLFYFR